MAVNVAFFGGSFNPPHAAHVLAAAYLRIVVGFDLVLVVPVFAHAFDKRLEAFEHRVRMCEAAFSAIAGVEVSREEERLETPSLTLRTLQSLAAKQPDWRLRLVIGADVLPETNKWHAFDQVSALAPPFVLGRVGATDPNAPAPVLPGISSTRVRTLLSLRDDESAKGELASLVPQDVLDYVRRHDLYRI
jgi:nicotinate-nucleotide adenylyltransferase